MPDDDYELMPHEEIMRLREELKKLKSGNPGSSLQNSIDELRMSIDRMLVIFMEASREIKEEGAPTLSKKIEEISSQNEKIAKAILVVVDMIKEKQPEIAKVAPPPLIFPQPVRMAQPLGPPREQMPQFQEMPQFSEMPPLPEAPPFGMQQQQRIPQQGFGPLPPPGFGPLPPPPPTLGPLPPLPPRKRGLFGR